MTELSGTKSYDPVIWGDTELLRSGIMQAVQKTRGHTGTSVVSMDYMPTQLQTETVLKNG